MTQRESTLARAWGDTEGTRGSLAWWIAAVLSGATLAVAAYYIAPGNSSLFFAVAGVVIGFFAPYVLALVWGLLGAYGRQRNEAWTEIEKLARRAR
jgi:hypothetical protein